MGVLKPETCKRSVPYEDGPNGPMVPELKEMFPDTPYFPRPGQINCWDNDDFVKAVKATGKKQLLIAGVATVVALVIYLIMPKVIRLVANWLFR